jgi:hypothetical protein
LTFTASGKSGWWADKIRNTDRKVTGFDVGFAAVRESRPACDRALWTYGASTDLLRVFGSLDDIDQR